MRQIDLIMSKFDFDKVHKYYVSNKWSWCDGKGDGGVPTIQQLKDNAQYLLLKVLQSEKQASLCGTGGFYAYKFEWGLELVFTPERVSESF